MIWKLDYSTLGIAGDNTEGRAPVKLAPKFLAGAIALTYFQLLFMADTALQRKTVFAKKSVMKSA
jgi:hypothetical protein